MKKSQLRQIIKEEISKVLGEVRIQSKSFPDLEQFGGEVDLDSLRNILVAASPSLGLKGAKDKVQGISDERLVEFIDYMLKKYLGLPTLGGDTHIEKSIR